METLTVYADESEREKAQVRAAIDSALKQAHDVNNEPGSVVTPELLNACEYLHGALIGGAFGGQLQTSVARVVIDVNKLMAENQVLRVRLKEAVNELLVAALRSNRFSLSGRR